MPRVAKKDYDTSFFHIMVQGIRKENIFNKDEYKEKYLELLYKYLEKYDVKIIAYCIMDSHAHLLVYVEKINELSEYMRSVNTTYALYYNNDIAVILNKECGLTHQEIANEFGVSRIKITRLINKKMN